MNMVIENIEERKKRKSKERKKRRRERNNLRITEEERIKERIRNDRIRNEEEDRYLNEKFTEEFRKKGGFNKVIKMPRIIGIEPINIIDIPIDDKPKEKKKSNLCCKALRNLHR